MSDINRINQLVQPNLSKIDKLAFQLAYDDSVPSRAQETARRVFHLTCLVSKNLLALGVEALRKP